MFDRWLLLIAFHVVLLLRQGNTIHSSAVRFACSPVSGECTSDEPDRNNKLTSHEALLTYTTNKLNIDLNPKIKLKPAPDFGGNALFTTEDLAPGEYLMKMPMEKALWYGSNTMEAASHVLKSKGIIDALRENLPNDVDSLTLTLLLLVDRNNLSSPYYDTYYKYLPESLSDDNVLLWSADELKELEQTVSYTTSTQLQQFVQIAFNMIVKSDPEFCLMYKISFEDFRLMLYVVFSRFFRVSIQENMHPTSKAIASMVPVADLFNHDCAAPVTVYYDADTKTYVMTTGIGFKAGEQVFTSYGPKSRGNIFIAYNFIPSKAHGHDYVYLPLLFYEGESVDKKKEMLEKLGITTLKLMGTMTGDDLFTIRLLSLKDDEVTGENMVLLKKSFLSENHKYRTLRLLNMMARDKLLYYPTTLESDARNLLLCKDQPPNLVGFCPFTTRHLVAMRLRLIEKTLLQETINFTRKYLIDNAPSLSNLPTKEKA